jgi:hypothetical protein
MVEVHQDGQNERFKHILNRNADHLATGIFLIIMQFTEKWYMIGWLQLFYCRVSQQWEKTVSSNIRKRLQVEVDSLTSWMHSVEDAL